MTDKNYTHLKAVVDRSGSMDAPVRDKEIINRFNILGTNKTVATEMVKALNEFFAEQAKVEGTCLVDYSQFDTIYETIYTDRPVSEAHAIIQPRGGTALNDAIGRGITELGLKFKAMAEARRPDKVLFVIVTDGQENSSVEYTRQKVREMIEHQTDKYNWNFVFLGANMDAVAEGASYGIAAGSSLTYDVNNAAAASASLSSYTTTYRGAGAASFTDEDRKANKS